MKYRGSGINKGCGSWRRGRRRRSKHDRRKRRKGVELNFYDKAVLWYLRKRLGVCVASELKRLIWLLERGEISLDGAYRRAKRILEKLEELSLVRRVNNLVFLEKKVELSREDVERIVNVLMFNVGAKGIKEIVDEHIGLVYGRKEKSKGWRPAEIVGLIKARTDTKVWAVTITFNRALVRFPKSIQGVFVKEHGGKPHLHGVIIGSYKNENVLKEMLKARVVKWYEENVVSKIKDEELGKRLLIEFMKGLYIHVKKINNPKGLKTWALYIVKGVSRASKWNEVKRALTKVMLFCMGEFWASVKVSREWKVLGSMDYGKFRYELENDMERKEKWKMLVEFEELAFGWAHDVKIGRKRGSLKDAGETRVLVKNIEVLRTVPHSLY